MTLKETPEGGTDDASQNANDNASSTSENNFEVELKLAGDVPDGLKGPGIIMIISGIISLAFLGFGGMVGIQ